MENNKKNVFKALGIFATLGAFAGLVYRTYRKSLKSEKESIDKRKSEMVSLGISDEDAENLIKENASISRTAHSLCTSGNVKFDLPDEAFDVKSARVSKSIIHVGTENIGNRNSAVITFEIPNYTRKDERIFIGEYIIELSGLAKSWKSRYNFDISMKLVGFTVIQYEYDGDTVVETIELPSSVYEEFAEGNRDGLTAFYEDLQRTGRIDDCVKENLGYYIYNDLLGEQVKTTVSFLRFYLGYKIVIPVKRWEGDEGISAEDLAALAKESCASFDIAKGNKIKTWDYVMFHPSDEEGNQILNLVFDERGQQVILNLPSDED